MQEELRRLEARILDLGYKLEVVTVDAVRADCEMNACRTDSPDHVFWSCRLQVCRMRSRKLQAKIVAAHARLGRLKLEAEFERLRSLQRPPTQVELAHLQTLNDAAKQHRRLAVQVIRRATDSDRACDRVTGDLPMPKRVQEQDQQQQPEVPRQQQQHEQYRGLRR